MLPAEAVKTPRVSGSRGVARHEVGCPTDFERADRLKAFQFQIQVSGVVCVATDEPRAQGDRCNVSTRFLGLSGHDRHFITLILNRSEEMDLPRRVGVRRDNFGLHFHRWLSCHARSRRNHCGRGSQSNAWPDGGWRRGSSAVLGSRHGGVIAHPNRLAWDLHFRHERHWESVSCPHSSPGRQLRRASIGRSRRLD